MRTCEANEVENKVSHIRGQPTIKPSHLHLVTEHDLRDLSDTLVRRHVPADLESKLIKLAKGDLISRSIEKNCRTIIALLQANQEGSFREATRAECERLLRLLAYVRKDDDAISDYRQDGFMDDQQEVRTITTDLGALLEKFKAWRLREQVPGMWQ
jgi:hypothetical protein